MNTDADHHEQSWGAKVQFDAAQVADWPTWANKQQQEIWNTHGLVVWDHAAQVIIGLRHNQALTLLDFLRITSDWRTLGLRIGNIAFHWAPNGAEQSPPPVQQIPEPVFAPHHGRANRNVRPVLSDPLDLPPAQAQHILTLLEAHEVTFCALERDFWEQVGTATASLFPTRVEPYVRTPLPTIEDKILRIKIEQKVRAIQRARAKKRYDRD